MKFAANLAPVFDCLQYASIVGGALGDLVKYGDIRQTEDRCTRRTGGIIFPICVNLSPATNEDAAAL